MRRRDFMIGLLGAAIGTTRAQEPAKQHRIAIIIPSGSRHSHQRHPASPLPAVFRRAAPAGRCRGTKPHHRAIFRRGSTRGLCRSRSRGRPGPRRDRSHYKSRRAGGSRGQRHDTDRLDRRRADRGRIRNEPGAPGGNITVSPAIIWKSGGSACRSSRKPSRRRPRPRFWRSAGHGKVRCCQVNLWRSEKPEAGCAIRLPPLHSAIRSPLRPERSVALIARRDGVEG